MSKPELINSTWQDENNGTEESETSDDNIFLTLQSYNRTCTNPMFQKSLQKKTAQEKNHQIQKKTLVGFEKLSGVLIVNIKNGY